MDQISEDELSEALANFVALKPYRSLSKLLKKSDFNDRYYQLNGTEYSDLKSALKSVQEIVFKDEYIANQSLKKLLTTIFQSTSLIMSYDAKIISQFQRSNQMNSNDENSSKTTIIKNLEEELSKAHRQIENLNDQIDFAKEDGINEVVNHLSHHYHLTNQPNTIGAQSSPLNLNKVIYEIDQLIKVGTEKVAPMKENIENGNFNYTGYTERQRYDSITDDDSFEDSPISSNDDPKDPSISRRQLVATVNQLRDEISEIRDKMVDEEEIIQIFGDIPMKSDEIEGILQHDDLPILAKIKKVVSIMSLNVFKSEDVIISNAKLISLVSGMFRFISSIGSSKASYASIYSETPFEDMRGLLLTQIERIQMFLSENAIGLVEDHCLFEDLIEKTKPTELMNHVISYVSKYRKPSNPENELLFIILMEAISAADVLHKYSNEAHQACLKQATDARQLRDYSKQLEKTIDDQLYSQANTIASVQQDESFAMASHADEAINAARAVLRQAVLLQKKEIEPVLEALNALNTTLEMNDDDYIQNLQNELAKARQINKDMQKNKEELMKQTHSDFLHVQKEIEIMKNDTNKKLQQKNKENRKLSKVLKEKRKELEEIKKVHQELSEKLEESKNLQKQNEEDSQELVNEIFKQFTEIRSEFDRVVSEMKREVEDFQEKKLQEFHEVKESLEKHLDEKQNKVNKEKKKIKGLLKRIGELEKEVQDKDDAFAEIKKNEEEAIDQAALLSAKYKEIIDDYFVIERENEMIKIKAESSEKNSEVFNSTIKNNRELVETLNEIRKEYDEFQNKSTKEMLQMLSNITNLFPSFTDLHVPISPPNILEMLGRVKQEIEKTSRNEIKLQKKSVLLEQIRSSLNISKDYQISTEIENILKKNKQFSSEAVAKNNEIKALQDSRIVYLQLQDWLIRMYITCTGGVCQEVTTVEMQHAIEDIVINSYENLVLSRRVGILRAEKKILLNKKIENALNQKQKKQPTLSIRHVLIAIMLILKTKKLAGHVESVYNFQTNERTETVVEEYDRASSVSLSLPGSPFV